MKKTIKLIEVLIQCYESNDVCGSFKALIGVKASCYNYGRNHNCFKISGICEKISHLYPESGRNSVSYTISGVIFYKMLGLTDEPVRPTFETNSYYWDTRNEDDGLIGPNDYCRTARLDFLKKVLEAVKQNKNPKLISDIENLLPHELK